MDNEQDQPEQDKQSPGRVRFEVERFRTFFLAGEQRALIFYFFGRLIHLGVLWGMLWCVREVMQYVVPATDCVAGCLRGSRLNCCFWSLGSIVRNLVFLFTIGVGSMLSCKFVRKGKYRHSSMLTALFLITLFPFLYRIKLPTLELIACVLLGFFSLFAGYRASFYPRAKS